MTNRSYASGKSPLTTATWPSNKRLLSLLGAATLGSAASASAAIVDVAGNTGVAYSTATHNLNSIVGVGNSGRLLGDFITFWNAAQGSFSVPVDTNGFALTLDTGGGNAGHVASGPISGTGSVVVQGTTRWNGGWSVPYTIGGTLANTYTGSTTVKVGNLTLNKTAGVDALPGTGTITLGSPTDTARVVWAASNQINDSASIVVLLPTVTDGNTADANMNFLNLAGFSDTVGSLVLGDSGTKTQIRTGEGGVLTVGSLTVGAVVKAPGTYTSASGGFITGTGSVVVLSGGAQIVVDISNATTPFEPSNTAAGVKIDNVVGVGKVGRLVGTTQTYWSSGGFSVPLDLNGNTLIVDSGNGNACNAAGLISGSGTVRFDGGGNVPVRVQGGDGNTYTGTTEIVDGTVSLEKSAGNALNGTISISKGGIIYTASNQIDDASTLTLSSASPASLNFAGFSDTIGALTVTTDSNLYLGSGTSVIHFADSSAQIWGTGKQLIIREWNGATTGGGSEGVFFGTSASGLTSTQLANVGFSNPAGFATGMYHAEILSTGELVPTGSPVQPTTTPYDLSPAGVAARAAIYNSTGRADLTAVGTPLEAGSRIVFFGDSLTWLNSYITKIDTALASGGGTTGQSITLINRGINGGGAIQLRDGSPDSGYPGSIAQASFDSLLTSDQADIAVVFIGINDVWWRGTSPSAYDHALRDMAASAVAKGVKLIFVTPAAYYESPIGADAKDPAVDQFAGIMRTVAADTGATLVDIRTVFVSYWQNNNYEIRLDGSFVTLKTSGLLTSDGIHATDLGNQLIADHISAGILASLSGGPTFDDWAAMMNLTGEDAAFDGDPDDDGISNGIEFVIGGEPNPAFPPSDSNDLLPTMAMVGEDMVFTFNCMNDAAYLNPTVVFSTDLAGPWVTAATMNATVVSTPSVDSSTVVVTVPKAAHTTLFARLMVVKP